MKVIFIDFLFTTLDSSFISYRGYLLTPPLPLRSHNLLLPFPPLPAHDSAGASDWV